MFGRRGKTLRSVKYAELLHALDPLGPGHVVAVVVAAAVAIAPVVGQLERVVRGL